jgi:hypothetical protein
MTLLRFRDCAYVKITYSHFRRVQEPRSATRPQLRDERRTYKILVGSGEDGSADTQIVGIPNVYHFGHAYLHNILVIDLLGPSLEDLFDRCRGRFSMKTVVMVAKQMVSSPLSLSQYFMLIKHSSREFKQSTKRISFTVTSSRTTFSLAYPNPMLPMSSI